MYTPAHNYNFLLTTFQIIRGCASNFTFCGPLRLLCREKKGYYRLSHILNSNLISTTQKATKLNWLPVPVLTHAGSLDRMHQTSSLCHQLKQPSSLELSLSLQLQLIKGHMTDHVTWSCWRDFPNLHNELHLPSMYRPRVMHARAFLQLPRKTEWTGS